MKEKQVFKNAKWIIACKIVQSILQFIVGMLCARYLGPSNYGLINYAASIVAFAMPLMKLGLDAILVYELVNSPEKEGEIMGTSLVLNVVSGTICMIGVTLISTAMNWGDIETIIVCSLYSLSIIFAAFEMIQYWFQYKLLSKYSSVTMLLAYVVVSAYKIFLLATKKSVYWFALSHSVEFGIIGTILIFIYAKKTGRGFSFSLNRAKSMINRSKHYILAAMMIVLIQNTDHIMLTIICGKSENGFYSAAITCVTIFQFVYVALVDSFRPMILSKKKENSAEYYNNISRLYGITLYTAIVQCMAYVVLAEFIIYILYGNDYANAVPVLRSLVFYFVFSVMGLVRNVWILAEEKQKYLWVINLSGALLNIVLNAIMIPFWGAIGAAIASLITQLFANFVLGFIIKPLRINNSLMLKGLNPKYILCEVKAIVKELRSKQSF